tara:strand:- start:1663 stop:1980 length:318 start_codon:yes stop_codon:yes gene_type:complete
MKYTIIILSICLSNILYSQTIDSPPSTVGLKISVTGVSLCMLGVSMKTQVVKHYAPHYGYNFTRVETTIQHRRTQLQTFLIGSVATIGGIIIQNLKNKNKKNKKK